MRYHKNKNISKMSSINTLLSDKEKKRPSVTPKCLLNIKSIVTQNVSLNNNNKNTCTRSPTSILPPLPLVDSLISSKESINHLNDIKENKQFPNKNVLIEYLQKSDLKKLSDKQISTTNGHDRSNITNGESKSTSIHISEPSTCKKDHEKLQSNIVSKELNSDQYPSPTSLLANNNELSIIPPLPLSSSMYPFNSSSSSPRKKPLSSFPVHSSNHINEEYLTHMHRIMQSSNNTNEIKPIELPIYRHQPISIHRFDSESPTISTIDDDEDGDVNINGPLVFVNSSLNLSMNSNSPITASDQTTSFKSRLSDRSAKEIHNNRKLINNYNQHYQPNPCYSTNFTRLPHSLRKNNPSFNHPSQSGAIRSPIINNSFIRRQFPQFEPVRTPVQKLSMIKQEVRSTIPSELFDCCQTETVSLTTEIITTQRNSPRQIISIENNSNESEVRSNYFRDTAKIREIMVNASKRLTQDQDPALALPIVDTHCHFDLIFDRLRIKHNNLTKYFNDYNEYYPSGLSFELAIQVFWRPKHLTEDQWLNWYSKYLDDERVYGSCGIHPHWSSAWNETCIDDIERCLQHPKIVAIGEIGLDYGPKNTCMRHEQRRAFEAQLKLAAKWLKPIVIHSRDAYEETFTLMKQCLEPNHKIHLHCFVGTIDDVYLFTSYFTEIKFGFTPIITRYNFLHTVIQQLELTQILSETDSPYFTPDELSTYSRCAHPGMVYSVIEMVAQLRHAPVFDVACQLRENARHIYGV